MQLAILNRIIRIRYALLFDKPVILAGAVLPFAAAPRPHPHWTIWLYIVIAGTLARSAGMAFNRYLDRKIDALNPRTASRAIPRGEVAPARVLISAIGCCLLFVAVCCLINPFTAVVSPLIVLMVIIYSLLKRFTPLCHFFLGFLLGLGPLLAAIAVCGHVPLSVIWFSLSFFLSITAADIVYGIQDYAFDKEHGVFSVPAWLGIEPSLWLARFLHALSCISLVIVGLVGQMGLLFYIAVITLILFLIAQHWKLRRERCFLEVFEKCAAAFGVLALVAVLGGVLWHV